MAKNMQRIARQQFTEYTVLPGELYIKDINLFSDSLREGFCSIYISA
jgi:hypothetical protein